MKDTIPVLYPVQTVNKRTRAAKTKACDAAAGAQLSEQVVNESLLVSIRKELTTLPTCSSQVINRQVHEHLTEPTTDNARMLDAWERCGRADFRRQLPVKFRNVIKETFSALGIACLVRYARGYLDEAEAATAAIHRRD